MNVRQWTRLFLLVPLLLSAIQLTPAQALTTNSVIWCPSAVTVPTSNRNGCSPLFPTMGALLSHLDTKDPAVAVTIWMGKDYNSATAGDGNIVIDGAALTRMSRYPLTIKGGWNGPGKSTINLNAPSTLDSDTIAIMNWNKKVVIKNISVVLNGASTAGDCGDPGTNSAVCVQTKGGIQLDRVNETNIISTVDFGVILDNRASVSSPPGSVVVTNGQFNQNHNSGMKIVTKGAVSLKSVITNMNSSDGAYIDNTSDATASPVTVTGGRFNQNLSRGLEISSNGTITLTNIYAEGNTGSGTVVDNRAGSGDVIIKGTNSFLGNSGDGLDISSHGNVTAQRLVAYQNAGRGVIIKNSDAPSAKGVTITGSGKFMGNYHGLTVASRGNVSLNGVIAASNTGLGIIVDADGNITLTCSDAYGNGTGLYVRSANAVGPAIKLTLKGFLNYGNATPEDILTTPTIRTACPTP